MVSATYATRIMKVPGIGWRLHVTEEIQSEHYWSLKCLESRWVPTERVGAALARWSIKRAQARYRRERGVALSVTFGQRYGTGAKDE